MEVKERRLLSYIHTNGSVPFEVWLKNLRDKKIKANVLNRLDRLRLGNFGDCRSIGQGVYELRIHLGSGYRIYFGLVGAEVVLLLCAGDKANQSRDINRALSFWMEYKENAQ